MNSCQHGEGSYPTSHPSARTYRIEDIDLAPLHIIISLRNSRHVITLKTSSRPSRRRRSVLVSTLILGAFSRPGNAVADSTDTRSLLPSLHSIETWANRSRDATIDNSNSAKEASDSISAIAAIIPGEALAIYAAVNSGLVDQSTKTEDGVNVVFKITAGLDWVSAMFILLPIVFYFGSRGFKSLIWQDIANLPIICIAMACWMALQKPSMIDYLWGIDSIPAAVRIALPLVVGAILLVVSKGVAQSRPK